MIERSEILEQAADVIEQRGWTTHTTYDGKGRVCAWGAMLVAAGWDPRVMSLSRERMDSLDAAARIARSARRFVDNHMLSLFGSVTSWNDMPGRTKQEVLDMLRSAAKELRKIEEGIEP
jgi:hypothetical protein